MYLPPVLFFGSKSHVYRATSMTPAEPVDVARVAQLHVSAMCQMESCAVSVMQQDLKRQIRTSYQK